MYFLWLIRVELTPLIKNPVITFLGGYKEHVLVIFLLLFYVENSSDITNSCYS